MTDVTNSLPTQGTARNTVTPTIFASGSNSTINSVPVSIRPPFNLSAMTTDVSVDTRLSQHCSNEEMYSYATLLPTLVSAVLVIAGWVVLNKAQANRERRKQVREHVDGLKNDLNDLEKMTIDYHTGTREMAVEQRVISRLGRFEKGCGLLPQLLSSQIYFKAMNADDLSIDPEHLKELSQAMTLKHFADEHTTALTVQDELVQRIELASEIIHGDLDCIRISALD